MKSATPPYFTQAKYAYFERISRVNVPVKMLSNVSILCEDEREDAALRDFFNMHSE